MTPQAGDLHQLTTRHHYKWLSMIELGYPNFVRLDLKSFMV